MKRTFIIILTALLGVLSLHAVEFTPIRMQSTSAILDQTCTTADYITEPEAVEPMQMYSTTSCAPAAKPRRADSDWDDTEENAGDVLPIGAPLLPLVLMAVVYGVVRIRRRKEA